eukprot:9850261-Karenia_brevis.AAC.1
MECPSCARRVSWPHAVGSTWPPVRLWRHSRVTLHHTMSLGCCGQSLWQCYVFSLSGFMVPSVGKFRGPASASQAG